MNHKTVEISCQDQKADVDVKIADLILNCWKAGIRTTRSCENNVPANWVWIEFFNASDAETFMEIVAGDYKENYNSLYNRIRSRSGHDKDWKFSVNNGDLSVTQFYDEAGELECESADKDRAFNLFVSIRFPSSDLKVVERRMQKFVDKWS